jgi:phospholipase/carboxylesterase
MNQPGKAVEKIQGELHTDPVSGLSYRLFEPAPARPARCLILVHGVGQNETSLVRLGRQVDDDTLVVFLRGRLTFAPDQYAFFHVSFTPTGPVIVEEEAEQSRQAVVRFVEAIQARLDIGPAATVIAGFSQGGIMATSLALSAPHLVAGFGLLSGRILPELAPYIAEPAHLTALKGFVAHGHQDATLPVSWAHRAQKSLTELGVGHEFHLYPGGHQLLPGMVADFLRWFDGLQIGSE